MQAATETPIAHTDPINAQILAVSEDRIQGFVEDPFGAIAEKSHRMFWMNPEPKLYWNYGDSVMAAYERYCTAAFECWTTRHLEEFVNVVAGGRLPDAETALPR